MKYDPVAERAANYRLWAAKRDRLIAVAAAPGASRDDKAAAERAEADLRGIVSRMRAMGDPMPPPVAGTTSGPVSAVAVTHSGPSAAQAAPLSDVDALVAEILESTAKAEGRTPIPPTSPTVDAVAARIITSDLPADEAGRVAAEILASAAAAEAA